MVDAQTEITIHSEELPVERQDFEEAFTWLLQHHSLTDKDQSNIDKNKSTIHDYIVQQYGQRFGSNLNYSGEMNSSDKINPAAEYFANYIISCIEEKGNWKGVIDDVDNFQDDIIKGYHGGPLFTSQVQRDQFLLDVGVPFNEVKEFRAIKGQDEPIEIKLL